MKGNIDGMLVELRATLAGAIEEWPHQNGTRLDALLRQLRMLSKELENMELRPSQKQEKPVFE